MGRRLPQQQQQVQEQKSIVTSPNMGEKAMVIDPHNADEGKADDKRNIGWPLPPQLRAERPASRHRHLDFQNQQCNRDGEYSIGEGFYAGGFGGHE